MPDWLVYLLRGIGIFVMLASSAVVLTKAGRSPYYALFWLVPFVQIILLWMFAFKAWPEVDKKES